MIKSPGNKTRSLTNAGTLVLIHQIIKGFVCATFILLRVTESGITCKIAKISPLHLDYQKRIKNVARKKYD